MNACDWLYNYIYKCRPKKFHKEHDLKRDLAKQYRNNIIERVRFQNTAIILERLLVETNLALK